METLNSISSFVSIICFCTGVIEEKREKESKNIEREKVQRWGRARGRGGRGGKWRVARMEGKMRDHLSFQWAKNPCSTLIGPLTEVQLCIGEFIDLALGYWTNQDQPCRDENQALQGWEHTGRVRGGNGGRRKPRPSLQLHRPRSLRPPPTRYYLTIKSATCLLF